MFHFHLHALDLPRIHSQNTLITLERRKATALLFFLATTGGYHSRSTVTDLFWSNYPTMRANANLRRVLTSLRDAFGDTLLYADRDCIGILPSISIWVDVLSLYEIVTHFDNVTTAAVDDLTILQTINLYRKPFLQNLTFEDSPAFEVWRDEESEKCRYALGRLFNELIVRYRRRQAWEQALSTCQRWVRLDPLHEPAHRELMKLYGLTNQRGAALQQYQRCVRMLREEYDVLPSDLTQGLYYQLQLGKRFDLALN